MSETILFYEPKQPYYEFSNFYNHKLLLDGYEWTCVEHYFQASKFYIPSSEQHMNYFKIIQLADSPTKIFMLGRQQKKGGYAVKWVVNKKLMNRLVNDVIDENKNLEIRPDWNDVRIHIMETALKQKFIQNKQLLELLINTGSKIIVENSPRDNFWGIGKDGKGQNNLGKLLMKLRTQFSSLKQSMN